MITSEQYGKNTGLQHKTVKKMLKSYKVPNTSAGNAEDGTKNLLFNEPDFISAHRKAGEEKLKRKRKPMTDATREKIRKGYYDFAVKNKRKLKSDIWNKYKK